MSGHVKDRLGDILAGRLKPDELAAVEAHMKECRDCASDLAWTREIRAKAMREGLRHLPASRIVELARHPGKAGTAEREHLDTCAECGGEIRWVEASAAGESGSTEAGAAGEGEPAARPPEALPGRIVPIRTWLAGGLAAAAVLLLLILPRLGGMDLSGLAVIEPLPPRLHRGIPEPGSFDHRYQQGMEAYGYGDYAAARGHLAAASGLRPGDLMTRLYLGSTMMLAGSPGEAAAVLRSVAGGAGDGSLRDEASWQLANALLLEGHPEEAEETLEALVAGSGRRSADARRLLEAMRTAR